MPCTTRRPLSSFGKSATRIVSVYWRVGTRPRSGSEHLTYELGVMLVGLTRCLRTGDLMSNSLTEIVGIHVSSGPFLSGADIDLFKARDNPSRVSVIFGRNGSGKTTVSGSLARFDQTEGAYLYGADNKPLAFESTPTIRVFNESYIREKVLIDDGGGLEAIVMLGDQAIASKRIKELESDILNVGKKVAELVAIKQRLETGSNSIVKLEKSAKDRAKDGGWARRRSLIEGGNGSAVLRAERWKQICEAETSSPREELESQFQSLLKQYHNTDGLGEALSWTIAPVEQDKYDEDKVLALLSEDVDKPYLTDREERLLFLARTGDQFLIEKTRELFRQPETKYCPMCQQEVSDEYKDSLAKSISKILSKKAEEYKERLESHRLKELVVPDYIPEQISHESRDALARAVTNANKIINEYNELVDLRVGNLYSPVTAGGSLGLGDALSSVNAAIKVVCEEIDRVNKSIRDRDVLRDRLYELNDQIAWIDVSGQLEKLRSGQRQLKDAKEGFRAAVEKRNELNGELQSQKAKLNATELAANAINRLLALVYFDSNRFRLVPTSTVYKIQSNGRAVRPKDVSTGERNILALCYFFLESGRGKFEGQEDSEPQFLIIDDPVSSFDMENRVGVCSLLRERIAHVLGANKESRITVLTHDAAVVDELGAIVNDLGLGEGSVKCRCDFLELSHGQCFDYSRQGSQYRSLLKTAYDFAVSENEVEVVSVEIGNVLRRIMEGYGTFNYAIGMGGLSRDPELKKRFGGLEDLLSSCMYRLALDDDSHLRGRANSLNPYFKTLRYSFEEKRILARCCLIILNRLDSEHIKKQLLKLGIKRKEIERNIAEWENQLLSRS